MTAPHSHLSKHQIERLWKHRENALANFHSVGSFMLVSESILVAVTGILLKEPKVSDIVKVSLIILGTIFTLLWVYIQGKQKFIIDGLKKRCEEEIPEYKEIRALRKKSLFRISNSWLLAYFIPPLFIVLWVIMLLAFITN